MRILKSIEKRFRAGKVLGKRSNDADKYADYEKRYGEMCDSLSIDFRRNYNELMQGSVPKKYARLVQYVPGSSVVEVGAGEGVLSLAMSMKKDRVRAIDFTPVRHQAGKDLQSSWSSSGIAVENCELVLGDVLSNPELMDGFETLVACRVIYYFTDRIDAFMEEVSKRCKFVCLIANKRRERHFEAGRESPDLGKYAYYSTTPGMIDLLERHGYEILNCHREAGEDPIVVGRRR
ncbi:MAG: class I SAM-dependent methyltransferase [Hyphomicrobiales bacterium]|nr:class I SAM-dependent methyltransferase [Nitratireductor sp.]MCC2096463.1 class I SAM-dependent methyltransferase [Hyphomicrobiales bacterium]